MLFQPGYITYHVMPTRPNIYNAMPIRPYHIPCHAHQAIEYTMLFPPGHTTYHAKPARPEHITCHARQAIPCTMPCTPDHTINHAITRKAIPYASQAIPYTMPCPPAISYTMQYLARPCHMPCQARQAILYLAKHRQAIPYTMPCPQIHTIYSRLTSPGHFDILCHARQTIP